MRKKKKKEEEKKYKKKNYSTLYYDFSETLNNFNFFLIRSWLQRSTTKGSIQSWCPIPRSLRTAINRSLVWATRWVWGWWHHETVSFFVPRKKDPNRYWLGSLTARLPGRESSDKFPIGWSMVVVQTIGWLFSNY
jgi:hypothetical protein